MNGGVKLETSKAEERIQRFNQAFLTGDADFIIDNVAEDVYWELVGETTLYSKQEVTKLFEPMRGVKAEEHQTETMITQGNQAIVQGTTLMPDGSGGKKRFAFCDIYTFKNETSDQVQSLKAFLIELKE